MVAEQKLEPAGPWGHLDFALIRAQISGIDPEIDVAARISENKANPVGVIAYTLPHRQIGARKLSARLKLPRDSRQVKVIH